MGKIRDAWPETPYPGDHIFGDCWCEECQDSVERIRGKSWMEIGSSDIGSDDGSLLGDSFLYYLPGMMIQSLLNPDDCRYETIILNKFVSVSSTPFSDPRHVTALTEKLSDRQREVLIDFIDWVSTGEFVAPMVVEAARRAIATGEVAPVPMSELREWTEALCKKFQENKREGG